MRRLTRILPLLALTACSALGITKHDDDALQDARARWNRNSTDSYSFVLRRSCFCGPDVHSPVRIVVTNGQRTSATYVESGQPVREDLLQLFPTMEGVFDLLKDAYAGADSIRVTYHEQLGHPMEAVIDYMKNAADDELSFLITEVQMSFPIGGVR